MQVLSASVVQPIAAALRRIIRTEANFALSCGQFGRHGDMCSAVVERRRGAVGAWTGGVKGLEQEGRRGCVTGGLKTDRSPQNVLIRRWREKSNGKFAKGVVGE